MKKRKESGSESEMRRSRVATVTRPLSQTNHPEERTFCLWVNSYFWFHLKCSTFIISRYYFYISRCSFDWITTGGGIRGNSFENVQFHDRKWRRERISLIAELIEARSCRNLEHEFRGAAPVRRGKKLFFIGRGHFSLMSYLWDSSLRTV